MTDLRDIFAYNLRKFRKLRGFTQDDLAERCRVSTGTIQSYEAKRRWPEKPYLEAIAKALNVPEVELFAYESAEKSQPQDQRLDANALAAAASVLDALSKLPHPHFEVAMTWIFRDMSFLHDYPELAETYRKNQEAL